MIIHWKTENMLIVIIKVEKKNGYMINLYLLFSKENLDNIEVANSYYFQCYLLVHSIYFKKYNLVTYNQLRLPTFSNKIELYDLLLLSTTQNTRPLYYTNIFCLPLSSISIEHLVMPSSLI